MKFKRDEWKEAYKAAVTKTAAFGKGSASGITCVLASLAYIRDGMIAEEKEKLATLKDAELKEYKSKPYADKVAEALGELFLSVKDDEDGDGGFASNASAAAKFAGIKASSADVTGLKL